MKATKRPTPGRSSRQSISAETIGDDPLAGLGLDDPLPQEVSQIHDSQPACDLPGLAEYADAVSFAFAAQRLVPGRPHAATLHRWATVGVKGFKLRTVRVGGRRLVRPGDIAEFLKKLNQDTEPDPSESARKSKQAGQALEALGC